MVIIALAAAATASLGAGTAAIVVQRKQLARLRGMVSEKGGDIADLIHHVHALQCKATEFEEMPKMMSVKRRTVQESTEKEIKNLQAKYAMSDEHLANLYEKCDKSDKQLADLQETFQDVPKLMSLQRRQGATLAKISTETGEQLQSLQGQMQEDIAALKEELSELSSLLTRTLTRSADLEKRVETLESSEDSSQSGWFSFSSLWSRK